MKRDLKGSGKVPPEVVRETLRRFNARANDRWSEVKHEMTSSDPPTRDNQFTAARVSRSGDDWEQPTLEEFIDQYRKPDVDFAKLEHSVWLSSMWYLEFDFINVYSTLHLDCGTKADLLYVGELFSEWSIEQAQREQASLDKTMQDTRESQLEYDREREQLDADEPPSKAALLWRWVVATTNHQVIGGVVAVAIITGIGLLIKAIAS